MVAAMVLLAACGGAGGGGGTIKIGILQPLTGDLGSLGGPMADAAKLAIKHVNEAGGILGKKIEGVVSDSQTDPNAARDAMEQLAKVHRVPVVIGPAASSETMATLEVMKANKITVISSSATSPALTTADDGGFFFRTVPSDTLQGAVLAQIASKEGYKNAAVIAINNDYGQAFAAVFKESFEKRGGKLAASAFYDPQGTTFTSEVNSVAAANPDVVILIGYPDKGSVVLREAYQQGLTAKAKFLMSEGMQSDDLASTVGKDNAGKYIIEAMRGTRPAAMGPTRQQFMDAFQKEYSRASNGPFDAYTYDATVVALLAMQKAGKADGDAIRQAMVAVSSPPGQKVTSIAEALKLIKEGKDIDYDGASGSLDMDQVGDPVSGGYEIWVVGADGLTTVSAQVTLED